MYSTDVNKYLLLLLRQNGVDLGVHLMFSERTLYLETVYFKEDRNLDIEESSIASFISFSIFNVCHPPNCKFPCVHDICCLGSPYNTLLWTQ